MYDIFYPEVGDQSSREEDLNVLIKIISKGKVVPTTMGHQYTYVYHGKNTYELEHHNLTLDPSREHKIFDKDHLLNNKELLENTFQKINIDQNLKVRSLDEVAFEYNY